MSRKCVSVFFFFLIHSVPYCLHLRWVSFIEHRRHCREQLSCPKWNWYIRFKFQWWEFLMHTMGRQLQQEHDKNACSALIRHGCIQFSSAVVIGEILLLLMPVFNSLLCSLVRFYIFFGLQWKFAKCQFAAANRLC